MAETLRNRVKQDEVDVGGQEVMYSVTAHYTFSRRDPRDLYEMGDTEDYVPYSEPGARSPVVCWAGRALDDMETSS
ncbi:hypothetical protein ACIBUR_39505 [Streptomyces anulatus]